MRNLPIVAFALSAIALIVLLAVSTLSTPTESMPNGAVAPRSAVLVHCAAAMRTPIENAAHEFEKEYGIRIQLQFNRSESLVTMLQLTKEGDLLIPADESYVADARALDLVEQDYALATLTAVLVVRNDFPKAAKSITWDDLYRNGFRLVQPNSATAIGKLTEQHLSRTEKWQRIIQASPAMVGTVTEAANAVKIGSADGAIIWDSLAAQYPTLNSVRLPGLEGITANVTAAVCKHASARTEARWFAEYLTGPGRKHFVAAGYAPPRAKAPPAARGANPGDDAEIVLYAGSMVRPALEETIAEFEKRENVRVTRVYNGCGILVAQMRTGRTPDLYLACDPRFMGEVADLFLKPEVISNNQLVIAVLKGNPAALKELKDLGKEGLRVGVGHEQQCALGAITKETFLKTGVYAAVRQNVKVESPTGDLLVNQLLTGALDAVVCYTSNVTPNLTKLDQIPVTGIPCASPEQPVAIAKGSANQELSAKLIEYIRSAESRERFQRLGFGWGARGPKK